MPQSCGLTVPVFIVGFPPPAPSFRTGSEAAAANTAGAGPAGGSAIASQPASDRSAAHQRQLAALTGLTPLGPVAEVVKQQPQKDGGAVGRRLSAAGDSASGADGAQQQRRPRTEEEKQAYKEAKLKERKEKELQYVFPHLCCPQGTVIDNGGGLGRARSSLSLSLSLSLIPSLLPGPDRPHSVEVPRVADPCRSSACR